jgi:hypothetical protein
MTFDRLPTGDYRPRGGWGDTQTANQQIWDLYGEACEGFPNILKREFIRKTSPNTYTCSFDCPNCDAVGGGTLVDRAHLTFEVNGGVLRGNTTYSSLMTWRHVQPDGSIKVVRRTDSGNAVWTGEWQNPLQAFGLPNVVPGIEYPEWFSDPKISAEDRKYLVTRFNAREWLSYYDMLQKESEPQIRTKDGCTLRLQPLLDALAAVGGALNPEASQVRTGNKRRGVVITPRDGYEQDTPSGEETSGNPSIDTIDKELRWYRRKYSIPPTLEPAPAVREN